jgi:hypothetical protein
MELSRSPPKYNTANDLNNISYDEKNASDHSKREPVQFTCNLLNFDPKIDKMNFLDS